VVTNNIEDCAGHRHWYHMDCKHAIAVCIKNILPKEDKIMQPVMTEFSNGDKIWLLHGKVSRTDEPAIVRTNGDKFWYVNGLLHRTDGPAVARTDGDKFWYLNGVSTTFDVWLERTTGLTDEQQVMLKLQYG
jgi:hypothetical protein